MDPQIARDLAPAFIPKLIYNEETLGTGKIRHRTRTNGFGGREVLLGAFVLLSTLAIVAGLFQTGSMRKSAESEAARMRRLFVAESTYEQSYDSIPAPSLPALEFQVSTITDFLCQRDPFGSTSNKHFPSDGSLPDGPHDSRFRVSDTYLWSYPKFVMGRYREWESASQDRNLGLISDEWMGESSPSEGFHATVLGPVARINMDGSFVMTPNRPNSKPLGDPTDLFVRRDGF